MIPTISTEKDKKLNQLVSQSVGRSVVMMQHRTLFAILLVAVHWMVASSASSSLPGTSNQELPHPSIFGTSMLRDRVVGTLHRRHNRGRQQQVSDGSRGSRGSNRRSLAIGLPNEDNVFDHEKCDCEMGKSKSSNGKSAKPKRHHRQLGVGHNTSCTCDKNKDGKGGNGGGGSKSNGKRGTNYDSEDDYDDDSTGNIKENEKGSKSGGNGKSSKGVKEIGTINDNNDDHYYTKGSGKSRKQGKGKSGKGSNGNATKVGGTDGAGYNISSSNYLTANDNGNYYDGNPNSTTITSGRLSIIIFSFISLSLLVLYVWYWREGAVQQKREHEQQRQQMKDRLQNMHDNIGDESLSNERPPVDVVLATMMIHEDNGSDIKTI